ncbi:MAG TPA: tRNA (adenosine(37)-N6)-threonylcarbamoyltransferase complex dimerization subunit type 1 TsaB [Perlabentimonas sp.]|jgi:tRNA threonylcarbamoyladenosine biosynthesis protein TsaB|nr:tRNA (adenosine(37)-N6)-threonylcarbamoyltransferase complex dimerization subunit type 1 TsaB [Tenuifilaceae bacterium]HZJ74566.1 tRNA (adenosine(37)-N6)-threonylcarbamoyltransferase complex dimerization subunit type 1 TsaB [Perlabentimonas sp.]
MNPLLCIETGTPTCSVALGFDNKLIDVEESHDPNNNHAKNLTVFIKNLLEKHNIKPANLAGVAISKGPGSYTGLRIGVSAAKGICYGANLPLIAVGSLNAMAHGALVWLTQNRQFAPDIVCPMIDARRMEVYTQLFNIKGESISDVEAKILDKSSYSDLLSTKKILFLGNGSPKAKDVIKSTNAAFIDDFMPSARFMLPLASRLFNQKKFEDVAYFEPLYLKDFIVTVAKNKVLGQK